MAKNGVNEPLQLNAKQYKNLSKKKKKNHLSLGTNITTFKPLARSVPILLSHFFKAYNFKRALLTRRERKTKAWLIILLFRVQKSQ